MTQLPIINRLTYRLVQKAGARHRDMELALFRTWLAAVRAIELRETELV